MGRQRNMPQVREQGTLSEKELNEMEVKHLSNTEFKKMVIKDAAKYRELSENYNSMKKDRETIKKMQSAMKNTVSEMRNSLEIINSRLDEAEVKPVVWKTRRKKKHD